MNNKIDELFERFPELESCRDSILSAYDIIKETFIDGGTLFTCGNGGSAADAEHMVGELMKGFILPRKIDSSVTANLKDKYGETGLDISEKLQEGFPAISLNGHPSLATAFGNDVDFEMIFAQQLYVLSKEDDALFGFTTSGNSVNILNAFKVAKALGIKTIAMTGQNGGESASLVDCCIKVPGTDTYKIQELQLPVYHTLCLQLEEEFYGG